jgi:hypothetical protein
MNHCTLATGISFLEIAMCAMYMYETGRSRFINLMTSHNISQRKSYKLHVKPH